MRRKGMPLKNILLDLGLRLFVGVVFLIAGTTKLPMHAEFTEVVVAYRILPTPLAHLYASVLPWLEITIGACLILGLLTRVFSLVSIPIIISFIAANIKGLIYMNGEYCPSCFGEMLMINYEGALAIDALLLIAAFLIFFQRKHFLTLDSQIANLSRFSRTHLSKEVNHKEN